MAIRFHLDENVSGAVATALRGRGIDVTTPADVGLIGANDHEHLQFALSQGRIVVTHDDDFTRLHAEGTVHCGICYCHKEKHVIGSLVRSLLLVHGCLTEAEMSGHLEYL
jgi:hypothetical protein